MKLRIVETITAGNPSNPYFSLEEHQVKTITKYGIPRTIERWYRLFAGFDLRKVEAIRDGYIKQPQDTCRVLWEN